MADLSNFFDERFGETTNKKLPGHPTSAMRAFNYYLRDTFLSIFAKSNHEQKLPYDLNSQYIEWRWPRVEQTVKAKLQDEEQWQKHFSSTVQFWLDSEWKSANWHEVCCGWCAESGYKFQANNWSLEIGGIAQGTYQESCITKANSLARPSLVGPHATTE